MNSKSSVRNVDKYKETLKERILGPDYELSLVFCGNTLSRKLNRTYRDIDEPTNVLAFPLSKNSGEIFINLSKLKGFTPLYLFIHGLLHLKGMRHGDKMKSEERKILKLFNGEELLSRNRRRQPLSQSRNSRRSSRRS